MGPTLTSYLRFDFTGISEALSHRRRLYRISYLPGFSGGITPSISERTEHGERESSVWKMLKIGDDEQDDPVECDSEPEGQREADEEVA